MNLAFSYALSIPSLMRYILLAKIGRTSALSPLIECLNLIFMVILLILSQTLRNLLYLKHFFCRVKLSAGYLNWRNGLNTLEYRM